MESVDAGNDWLCGHVRVRRVTLGRRVHPVLQARLGRQVQLVQRVRLAHLAPVDVDRWVRKARQALRDPE